MSISQETHCLQAEKKDLENPEDELLDTDLAPSSAHQRGQYPRKRVCHKSAQGRNMRGLCPNPMLLCEKVGAKDQENQ